MTGMAGFAAPESVITWLAGLQVIITGQCWLIAENI